MRWAFAMRKIHRQPAFTQAVALCARVARGTASPTPSSGSTTIDQRDHDARHGGAARAGDDPMGSLHRGAPARAYRMGRTPCRDHRNSARRVPAGLGGLGTPAYRGEPAGGPVIGEPLNLAVVLFACAALSASWPRDGLWPAVFYFAGLPPGLLAWLHSSALSVRPLTDTLRRTPSPPASERRSAWRRDRSA
jgi:hypothetical protein